MTRHEPLVAILEQLKAALIARDAEGAEQLTAATVRLVTETKDATEDERVLPLLAACDALASTFHQELCRAMQGSATSSRAARSYERSEEAR